MNILNFAKSVIKIEANAILTMAEKLDHNFINAVDLIKNCKGKVIFTGMGKSGHIAKKLAATFSSTGTPSFFLHPAEATHGDLGIVGQGDLVIAISYSGESSELNGILKYVARKDIPLISMTGKLNSTLAKYSNISLSIAVTEEACPLGLAPTASSTATLALGDALAMAVLRERGFTDRDFAEYHPGGSLGFKLLTKVKDIMHSGLALPLVKAETSFKEIVNIMTHRDVRGAAGVIGSDNDLIGVITDGDIRRFFDKNSYQVEAKAIDIMSQNPKTINGDELVEKAINIMEIEKVQMLFVLSDEKNRIPVGIVGIQDVLRAQKK